jgi:hypothetical protein
MCRSLLTDPALYERLLDVDRDLAEQTRERGCPHCGETLHSARYPRKPRGAPTQVGAEANTRFSFCCSNEGCRRRVTPPSVRFLGRRHYLGALVVLITAMCHGLTPRRVRELERLCGANRTTLLRWRQWWREVFPRTDVRKLLRGFLVPPVDLEHLCQDLVLRFQAGHSAKGLVNLLRFLSPASVPSWPLSVHAL